MTKFSPEQFRDGLRQGIANRIGALQRLQDRDGKIAIEQQMTAVKLMAETILDLTALSPSLTAPRPRPLLAMLNLALHAGDGDNFERACIDFAAMAKGLLDIEEERHTRTAERPF